ncbi:MAG: oligosaccharide flippase family protein [Clostridia bacterium]|nr:oligosaccharide flippase family protein [Clostridia bacterium]
MSNAKRLLINTLMLTASSFLMRTVSVSFNVYITNIIGAEGIGLFQLVSTVYAMAITFSSAGIRLASMRLIADSLALGKQNQRQIMKRCLFYGFVCGVIIGLILIGSANIISTKWLESESTASSLRILSISLPFVSMSAALNGYFTSEGKIMRYTSVQIFEQLFKIGITVFFISRITHKSSEEFCEAIVMGISLAEMFSLLSSYSVYRFTSRTEKDKKIKNIWNNLFRIALPDAIGSQMRSVLTTVEHILIPKGLKKSGGSVSDAIATYGIVHGMTLPVILYPSALISSLSGLLVPEISSHHTSGQQKRIYYIIRRVLHLTLIFAIGTAGIMFFNAEKLSYAFYENDDCSFYIKILAPLIVVMYMDTSVDGMLKGLDQQMSYMKYNIIDAGSCVALVYFLVPVMGVKGYILVIYLSELINFVLSFRRLTIVSEVEIEIYKDLVVPLLGIIVSCLCGEFISKIFSFNISFRTITVFYIVIEVSIYFSVLRLFKAIDQEETLWLKRLILRKS